MSLVPAIGRIQARLKGANGAVLGTAATSLLVRGMSVIASLLTVPIVLHHLGPQRYGVWMAAMALSTFFILADGGVTKGLIAEVARAAGAGNRPEVRQLTASALVTTLVFAAPFAVGVLIVATQVNWTWAFNLRSEVIGDEARYTVMTISLIYVFALIPTVIRETRVGLLQGAAVNLWDAAGLALAFLGIVLAARWGAGLVVIAGIWAGGPAIMRTANAVMFLLGQGRDLTPRRRDIDFATCRTLTSAGSVFMLYSLALVLAVNSDQILIARFLGPETVTQYSIVQRLFNQSQVIVTLGLAAQWPAYGMALGRGDYEWIRRHFRWSLIGYAGFSAVVSGAIALLCHPILKLWVGGAVTPPTYLPLAFGVYGVVGSLANVFLFFYMSLAIYRRVIVAQVALIVLALPLYFFLIPRLGSVGAVVAITIAQTGAVVAPGLLTINSLFKTLGARNKGIMPSDSMATLEELA